MEPDLEPRVCDRESARTARFHQIGGRSSMAVQWSDGDYVDKIVEPSEVFRISGVEHKAVGVRSGGNK